MSSALILAFLKEHAGAVLYQWEGVTLTSGGWFIRLPKPRRRIHAPLPVRCDGRAARAAWNRLKASGKIHLIARRYRHVAE